MKNLNHITSLKSTSPASTKCTENSTQWINEVVNSFRAKQVLLNASLIKIKENLNETDSQSVNKEQVREQLMQLQQLNESNAMLCSSAQAQILFAFADTTNLQDKPENCQSNNGVKSEPNNMVFDLEAIIFAKVELITGLPQTELALENKFESELGMDSLGLLDLWTEISENIPSLKGKMELLQNIQTIGDLVTTVTVTVKSNMPQQSTTSFRKHPNRFNNNIGNFFEHSKHQFNT